MMRINKYLSEAGICSRREADRLIQSGRVQINGKTASPGDRVLEDDKVELDQKEVPKKNPDLLYAFYKPRGIVCTEDPSEPANIRDYLKHPVRLTYMGRLDKDSEGLLLLTNNGDWIELCMRGSRKHEKEYEVTIDRPVTKELLSFLSSGVYLPRLDRTTRKCRAWKTEKNVFHIVLTQGLNRQIRYMCEEAGVRVLSLKRLRVLNIRLDNMKPGELLLIEDPLKADFLREIGWKSTNS